jgi:catechol 2,3-dioxygenase-like lactoylglutathione lyase family enzyme
MFTFPKPKLGDVSAITVTTTDLEESLKFYQSLGFSEIWRNDFPFPWIQISDGALLMMLRKDEKPYIALTYYVKELDKVITELEQAGISFIQKPGSSDMIKRYVFQSPDDLNIALVTHVEGFNQPPGPTMLNTPQGDYFKPEKYVNKTAGLFGEFAHPVKNMEDSLAFWEKLGFKVLSKHESPYPWSIISDGLAVVGLHQSDHFSSPAITYFAADMKDKIEKLKSAGLKNFKEKDGSSNITVTSPEKQQVFLFKLGM